MAARHGKKGRGRKRQGKARKDTFAPADVMTIMENAPTILVLGHVTRPLARAGANVITRTYTDQKAADLIKAGEVDGLLLTGGGDVNPELYLDQDEMKHRQCYGIDDDRDDAEFLAIAAADEAGIPVMGICRGAQMINVAYGGTLHQNIEDDPKVHDFHGGGHEHRVRSAAGSRLQKAWGSGDKDTRWVISIHHQAVKDVAPGFVATGWGMDGVIEAIEAVEGWILGVQFHPEMAYEYAWHQRIFDRFVAAAAEHRGLEWKLPSRRDGATRHTTVKKGGRTYHYSSTSLAQPATKRSGTMPAKSQMSPWATPAISRWRCFRCTLEFDEHVDYVDHMLFLHGVDVFTQWEPSSLYAEDGF